MSRALSLAALVVSTGLLAACQTTGSVPAPPNATPPSASVFRPGDFSWSAVPGKGRIEGQLAYRGAEGGRYTCSGAGVVLTPETLWSRRRMTILYNSPDRAALPADEVRARTPSAPSGDYSAFVRRTTCDANDHFSYSGLPNGAWFLITVAKPVAGSKGPDMAVMRRIEIRGGKAISVGL